MATSAKAALVSVGALAGAVITILTTFTIVGWTASQTALVTAESVAVVGLASAVVADLWPDTKREPVALAATFTAALSATIALGSGFGWWNLSAAQTSALVSLVTTVIGVGTALGARQLVTAGVTPK
ncbi:MAG TPA: hypothetical protein VG165_15025 [Solirubrobacteraceae bacterium]|jgi:hypothetical protein|nr:hypothetical protein [Solirubrobacteraceae bacterium]